MPTITTTTLVAGFVGEVYPTQTITAIPIPGVNLTRSAANKADGSEDDLGDVASGSATEFVYTVESDGDDDLILDGSPKVAISGESNCTATVTAQPTSPINPGSTTTITIDVTPTVDGAFSFDLSMDNDDSDENPYNLSVIGTGISAAELAELDFASVSAEDPYTGSAAWPLFRNFVNQSEATGSRWESKPTNGQVSTVAAIATIDMTGETKVYVMGDTMLVAGAKATALMLSKKYDNGLFWDADGGGDAGEIDGYLLLLTKNSITVNAYRGVASESPYATNNFGNPLGGVDGTVDKVEMRVTLASPNVIQVFVDDIQLGSDWSDSNVDRTDGIKTCGASVVGSSDIVAITRISAGTFI